MMAGFAGGVAHELGAPLNVIQGRARILARARACRRTSNGT